MLDVDLFTDIIIAFDPFGVVFQGNVDKLEQLSEEAAVSQGLLSIKMGWKVGELAVEKPSVLREHQFVELDHLLRTMRTWLSHSLSVSRLICLL